MEEMSKQMQVIAITHLPQIAIERLFPFRGLQEDQRRHGFHQLRQLTPEERVAEIARMLSGAEVSVQAGKHASHAGR